MPVDSEKRHDLAELVRKRRDRRDHARETGEMSLGQSLAWIGAFGWLVVAPTLAGLFAGRWLDSKFHTGAFWTLSLLTAGLACGAYLVWRRIQEH